MAFFTELFSRPTIAAGRRIEQAPLRAIGDAALAESSGRPADFPLIARPQARRCCRL